jgi:hypothetical protein
VTRVIHVDEGKGATWPNLGPPRGTPNWHFGYCLIRKNFGGPRGSTPGPLPQACAG